MDYKVIWTEGALTDIESIAQYIEKDSFFYASSVVSKIIDISKLISTFPLSGRMIPEEENEFVREHFVYNYRLIYEIQGNIVYVLAIVHSKRMLYPELKQRFKK